MTIFSRESPSVFAFPAPSPHWRGSCSFQGGGAPGLTTGHLSPCPVGPCVPRAPLGFAVREKRASWRRWPLSWVLKGGQELPGGRCRLCLQGARMLGHLGGAGGGCWRSWGPSTQSPEYLDIQASVLPEGSFLHEFHLLPPSPLLQALNEESPLLTETSASLNISLHLKKKYPSISYY